MSPGAIASFPSSILNDAALVRPAVPRRSIDFSLFLLLVLPSRGQSQV